MQLIYNIFIWAYGKGIQLAALFNDKAAALNNGFKQVFSSLPDLSDGMNNWIWFHAASLGEFEQGRPLIEAIKKQQPHQKILLTFFSPSGYQVRKDYPFADIVSYLPLDTPENAERFISILNPKLVIFIKYEFWFNYMQVLRKKNIPLVFVSARFRKDQYFFRFYGHWFLSKLKLVSHYFVQDEQSMKVLESNGIEQVTISGDTRFDRVHKLAEQAQPFPEVERFINERKAIVIGSSWPEDETHLFKVIRLLPDDFCFIIAPHDISEKHIKQILGNSPVEVVRYSRFSEETPGRMLVIDTIGMLSQLYQYACFAYVGGGFGKAIHNIQEPVAFGCPVIIGPNFKKFTEAVELIRQGGVISVANTVQMRKAFDDLAFDQNYREVAAGICKKYARENIGATEKIITALEEYLIVNEQDK